MLGYSQVGKAIDFDSIIPWFESMYPIQITQLATFETTESILN